MFKLVQMCGCIHTTDTSDKQRAQLPPQREANGRYLHFTVSPPSKYTKNIRKYPMTLTKNVSETLPNSWRVYEIKQYRQQARLCYSPYERQENYGSIRYTFHNQSTAVGSRCVLTSSVMSVAIDLPISWYCGALPAGPNNKNRNLRKQENRRI